MESFRCELKSKGSETNPRTDCCKFIAARVFTRQAQNCSQLDFDEPLTAPPELTPRTTTTTCVHSFTSCWPWGLAAGGGWYLGTQYNAAGQADSIEANTDASGKDRRRIDLEKRFAAKESYNPLQASSKSSPLLALELRNLRMFKLAAPFPKMKFWQPCKVVSYAKKTWHSRLQDAPTRSKKLNLKKSRVASNFNQPNWLSPKLRPAKNGLLLRRKNRSYWSDSTMQANVLLDRLQKISSNPATGDLINQTDIEKTRAIG